MNPTLQVDYKSPDFNKIFFPCVIMKPTTRGTEKNDLIRRCFTMNGVIGIMNATAISLPLWMLLIFSLRMFL